MLVSIKVEHVDYLWVQHTHYLNNVFQKRQDIVSANHDQIKMTMSHNVRYRLRSFYDAGSC